MTKRKVTVKLTKEEDFSPSSTLKEDDWREKLTGEQYRVLREKGTERALTGIYDKHFRDGMYVCAGCGTELFDSTSKYNSGCGWPAFDAPLEDGNITYIKDSSFGLVRIEIVCSNCGGHLGHVFDDGPKESTGLRYCVNSASLSFEEKKD
jgi:peptide-methionine (R)-S-oxide reductase